MNENTTEGRVVSVNISKDKGTIKSPVQQIVIDCKGIQGDAHAGNWHRQLSLLAEESITGFEKASGRKISFGEFAENITTTGIAISKSKAGDRLIIGDSELEVTQIGKKCHGSNCAIFRETGWCVMPKEGIFARVIRGGSVRAGDKIRCIPVQS